MRRAVMWVGFLLPVLAVGWLFAREEGTRFMAILEAWQTLTAGLIAIGAAFIGARAVNRQTAAQERRADELRRVRFDAERANLAVTAKDLYAYTTVSGAFLAEAWSIASSNTLSADPAFPEQAAGRVVAMIEASPDKAVRSALAHLIRKLQVQSARVLGTSHLVDTALTLPYRQADLARWAVDTAELQSLVDELFKFAREETGFLAVSFNRKQICDALKRLTFDEVTHAMAFKIAEGRFKP
ncbi:hypothetical protein D3C72_249270 [compost metagenome]